MRVLGIDPGLIITGYACVEMTAVGSEPRLIEGGVLRLDRRAPMSARLEQLFNDLTEVLDDLEPEQMAVEQLFAHYRHVRTSIIMGHARGVILLAGQTRSVELVEVVATEVKKAMTGNGHATKRQMQEAAMVQLSLSRPPEPADVADAIGIALCAARRTTVTGSPIGRPTGSPG